MNIKKLIKAEFQNCSKLELFVLFCVLFFILLNAFVVKDNIIAVVSAICGILYSFFAGKGKIYCYIFGLSGTFCYSWLSFENSLWGNLLLYAGYYFPMQVVGCFAWRKNLKKDKLEVKKTKLQKRECLIIFVISVILSVIAVKLIEYFKGSYPLFDGVTLVLSLFGMYLTVRRAIEQWVLWGIVNALGIVVWANLVMQGSRTYSTLIMWIIYFLMAVYFYIKWNNEIKISETVTSN